MTPDKCGASHDGSPGNNPLCVEGGAVVCEDCGARWVPSDVLEEARRDIQRILDDYGFFDGNSHMRMSNEIAHILARIDGVLGK